MKYIKFLILGLIIISISILCATYLAKSLPKENYSFLFNIAVIIISIGSIAFPRHNLSILRGFSKRSGFTTFQKVRLTTKIKDLRKMCWHVFYFGILLTVLIFLARAFASDILSLTILIVASTISIINFIGQGILAKRLDLLNDDFERFLNKTNELKKMDSSTT